MNSEIERGTPLKMTDLGKQLGLDVRFATDAIYVGPGKFPELIRVMYEGLRGPISFHRNFWAVR
ncbi:hypothetical protein LCGC14_2164680 [marine sediment metagenome]|uniref:Uncharacterized protein n=1 Tax=marine sediment metagenome TaxID=412755 RepID=A0A0F9GMW9_9ZZZZ